MIIRASFKAIGIFCKLITSGQFVCINILENDILPQEIKKKLDERFSQEAIQASILS